MRDTKNNKTKEDYSTTNIQTRDIGAVVDEIVNYEKIRRKGFERRWYDNNFFDDGFHFRYLSRSTNRIVDLSERSNVYSPMRAIPKASRQIRGVANLLVSNDPAPTVYPDKVDKTEYKQTMQLNPQTGQQEEIDDPAYIAAVKESEKVAKHTGYWLTEEFKEQEVTDQIALMAILTGKHGVSWMKIWPDAVKEKINTQVRDAFDIMVRGSITDPENSPYMIEVVPQLISEIKANENFDPEQMDKISPDNRQASSEIKEAYMNARFNRGQDNHEASTLLLKEAYLKEYLNATNMDRIRRQENGAEILKGKEVGDTVLRQVFVAGNIWLRDEYVNLPAYPFVDYRMEPGPIYQVPLIERFIPMNKSLDVFLSRGERFANTMVTGTWLKRQGEQFTPNNIAGGQVIEYQSTPPTQANIASIPPFYFELMQMMSGLIEEQGVSTSTLGKVPPGVKANAAIETLKQSEYANLQMASARLKTTIKHISERFLNIADHQFITPQTVYYVEKGKPKYFDVIGHSALKGRSKMKVDTPSDVIPLKGDSRVDIEIESGLGFTKEGQKGTMLQLFQELDPYVQQGLIPQEAFKVALEQFLKVYQFGATAEFMEAMENGKTPMTDQEMMMMKTALLEALKDAGEVGPEADETKVQASKLGTLQALKDSGLAKMITNAGAEPVKESVSINYKDAPEDVKRQMEQEAGFTPSESLSPSGTDQAVKHADMMKPDPETKKGSTK